MDIEEQVQLRFIENAKPNASTAIGWIPSEFVRKSLHLLIALVPPLASVSLPFTFSLLAAGILFYAFAEASRRRGSPVPMVSDLTIIASRERDNGKFVLGPITLGIGAMLALMLYPEPAATIAIYALAFGDGIASLAGKALGGPRIPRTGGKTFSGSLACFSAVLVVALGVTSRPWEALTIAGVATLLEALPTGNYDNLVIPFGVGLAASWILQV